ncbi:6-phosphogluconate dehydrogenase [Multifurca ochricompacta]|uniref:6-phosphogluconate dehydrogenase n=1 Tax=Multifurca ochricompacta TaxID=376703 RepID=A0AAD4LYU3_9AGAM|nr:6-phosphogluconate dehydrogenase [Multifurca ochricompacta]
MPPPQTIAIIAAGAMGSAVAQRLINAGATRERARDAGMRDVPFPELTTRKDYLTTYNAAPVEARAESPIYVDCNAVSPETVKGIASLFADSDVRFIDACIIGWPPKDNYNPTFYAAAGRGDGAPLSKFAELRSNIGDASALKMSYAGIVKGLTGLFTTMILSAHAASPATADALLLELRHSQPALLDRLIRAIPDMLPKAYRWVDEMREISGFVGGPLGGIHEGMANLYERMVQSIAENGDDKRILEAFVEAARRETSE